MVPKIAYGFLVFGLEGSEFRRRGGPILGPRGGQHGRARRGLEARTGGANSGAICGGDSGVMAGPATGIFLEIWSHMCRYVS